MGYPEYIKSTKDYIMYQYYPSGMLEISHMESDFKQQYIGYGRQQAVRMFRKELKERN
jgi:hypothetical protein